MTILVTRPSPDGEQLAHQLCAVGLTAIHQPLLAITSGDEVNLLISQLNWLKSDDFLIAVSDHAVKLAHNYLQSQGASWPKNVHYMAVGHKTAATLAKVTGQSVLMPQHRCDSEGLLALPELQQIHHRRVLILRGNGGRELIRQELIARHAEVHYCKTYQRCWLPLDGTTLADSWLQQQVDKLVVTSGEQLAFSTNSYRNIITLGFSIAIFSYQASVSPTKLHNLVLHIFPPWVVPQIKHSSRS